MTWILSWRFCRLVQFETVQTFKNCENGLRMPSTERVNDESPTYLHWKIKHDYLEVHWRSSAHGIPRAFGFRCDHGEVVAARGVVVVGSTDIARIVWRMAALPDSSAAYRSLKRWPPVRPWVLASKGRWVKIAETWSSLPRPTWILPTILSCLAFRSRNKFWIFHQFLSCQGIVVEMCTVLPWYSQPWKEISITFNPVQSWEKNDLWDLFILWWFCSTFNYKLTSSLCMK